MGVNSKQKPMTNNAVKSIGEHLKKEREAKGISLQEIANSTNISPRFLEAIEREEFEVLPGEIFVKGFMKNYAAYIGLDAAEISKEYQKRFEAPESQQASENIVKQESITPFDINHEKKFVNIWPAVIGLLALAGLGYYLRDTIINEKQSVIPEKRQSEAIVAEKKKVVSETQDKPPEQTMEVEKSDALPKEKPVETEVANASGPATDQAATEESLKPPKVLASPLPPSDAGQISPEQVEPESGREGPGSVTEKGLDMKLSATSDAWMLIKRDNSVDRKDFILRAGETIVMKADEKFTITTGNASGVKIIVNGKNVAWPDEGKVIHNFILMSPREE